jgi:hypothetical protein
MKLRIRPRFLIVTSVSAGAAYFLISALQRELSIEASVPRVVLSVAAYFCLVILLLVPALTLVWFVFTVWGKAYYRAWHIQRIRNSREMRRVVLRDQQEK